jgi:hypothetical protein
MAESRAGSVRLQRGAEHRQQDVFWQMNETRAIELCIRHRDPAGFEYLVKQYRREAFGHALALLGNADDAAEACQESFISAFGS